MTVITVEQVSAVIKGGVNPRESDLLATILIPLIVAQAEGHLNRGLEIIDRHETGLDLQPDQDYLYLRFGPVRSVSEVKIDDVVWPARSWRRERSGLRLWGPVVGPSLFTTAGLAMSSAEVTYIGGIGEPGVTEARWPILTRTARTLAKIRDDELGLESLTVEGYSAKYLSEGWTKDEEAALNRAGRHLSMSSLQSSSIQGGDRAWPYT